MRLELQGVSVRVGADTHLYPTTVALASGAINVLLGPTLAGKTTLMRVMAGLDRPADGKVIAPSGLDCHSLNSCMVAGFDTAADPPVGALLRTTGRESYRVALATTPATFILNAVACSADGTCLAVGGTEEKYARGGVVWISPTDKVRLTVPYIPQPYGTQLTGVSCNPRCVAVGQGASAGYLLTPYAVIAR